MRNSIYLEFAQHHSDIVCSIMQTFRCCNLETLLEHDFEMNMPTKRSLVGKKMSSVVIATIQQSICSTSTVFDHFVKINE